MTIRFLSAWKGYSAGDIATLSNEATLVAAGLAYTDLDGANDGLTYDAKLHTDFSNNTVLLGPDGKSIYKRRDLHKIHGSPNYAWGGTNIVAGDYSAGTGTPTLSVVERYGKPALKVVTGAGTTSIVNLLINDTLFYGRYIYQVEAIKSEVVSMSLEVTPDAYTNSARRSNTILTNPVNVPREQQPAPASFWYGDQIQIGAQVRGDQLTGNGASWGTANPTFPTNVNAMRLTITPQSGVAATVYIYGVSFAPKRKKARCFVTCDDGYESFVRNGLPMMTTRGIPLTSSIITSRVDDRTGLLYNRKSDLATILDAGGQIVAHGPETGLGSGTLFTAYTNNADRLADMERSRDWIYTNGFDTPGFEQCYVWPGGEGQAATGDLTLFDVAMGAGFTVARGASPNTSEGFDFTALTRYQRMMLPILGHTSASNISTITTQIAFAADHGLDCCLMFHGVVKAGATPGTIEITTTDLGTILDAIQTEVAAGDMVAGVLGDLGNGTSWN
jgi:hypothetical protein